MSVAGHVLFNLLCNCIGSFVFALGLVYLVLRWGRVASDSARLWLLLLPFGKLLFDLVQGVPQSSFLWAKLAGQSQDLGTFHIGLGVASTGPLLRFELGAYSGGLLYPQSAADVLDAALTKRMGELAPTLLAMLFLSVGLSRLGLRLWRSQALLHQVRRDARLLGIKQCGRQRVQVWMSRSYHGVPFAAGILRPQVVFSERTHSALDEAEREAALHHELAHIAHFDPALHATLCVLDDLFWFLPGARGLLSRIHRVLELRADSSAIAAGVEPLALARALASVGEIARTPLVSSAMASDRGLLSVRVQRLLQDATATRAPNLWHRAGRLALLALVTITVTQAHFLGNRAAALMLSNKP